MLLLLFSMPSSSTDNASMIWFRCIGPKRVFLQCFYRSIIGCILTLIILNFHNHKLQLLREKKQLFWGKGTGQRRRFLLFDWLNPLLIHSRPLGSTSHRRTAAALLFFFLLFFFFFLNPHNDIQGTCDSPATVERGKAPRKRENLTSSNNEWGR